jgi:hypothetical protein
VSDSPATPLASPHEVTHPSDFYICPTKQRQTAAYHRDPVAHRTAAEWHQLARAVVLDVLADHHAVTTRELEARAADYTWKPTVCPAPVQPHLLTTAVQELVADGHIQRTTATTRGGNDNQGVEVTTLSLTTPTTNKRTVEATAARKRLLTARHNGWASQRNLIGPAGEEAMTAALHDAKIYAAIQPNVTELFGQKLVGEVDCSCVHVDTTTDLTPVLILTEIKNTREWYYDDTIEPGGPLRRLLRKAAALQHANPHMMIAPLFVVRRAHATLVRAGNDNGFMVASVYEQLITSDSKLTPEAFAEVRTELGYGDLRLDAGTTRYHAGIAKKMIPKTARPTAERWRTTHAQYLEADDLFQLF